MGSILAVTFPFFALVAAGYVAARWRWLPLDAVSGLNAFVLYFALPCMLFRLGASLPLARLLDPAVLGLYALAGLAVIALTLRLTSPAVRRKDAAFGALVAAFPNSGFMGVPLINALVGPERSGPVIATLLVDLFLTSSVCIALAQSSAATAASNGMAGRIGRAARAASTNPQPWAIGAGALASVLSLRLPGPVDQVVAMLAQSASPVALFTIGAVLWRGRQLAESADAAPNGTAATHTQRLLHDSPVALVKLFVHPALVWALGRATQAIGAPLTSDQLAVLVLVAALPSAANVALLVERDGADTARVVRIIMVSTTLSFFTFSAAVWWLLGSPER